MLQFTCVQKNEDVPKAMCVDDKLDGKYPLSGGDDREVADCIRNKTQQMVQKLRACLISIISV